MKNIRKAADRGSTQLDWLDSRHTFSFGDYYDPNYHSFGVLRVINDDRIAGGGGFPTHGHRDMEIMTYVMSGALRHRDSLGTGSVIRAGELQRMTAGSGILHSEMNDSKTEPVHLYQIWIMPARRGLTPGYEQVPLASPHGGGLVLGASPDGRNGSLTIQQDAELWIARVEAGRTLQLSLRPGRSAWIQCTTGAASFGGHALSEGDGAAVTGETALSFESSGGAELLLFDLPGVDR
jgi:hypothetical protein